LRDLAAFFELHHVRYMVIGGLANTVWGRPRATYDADVKVILGALTIAEFGELVGRHFAFRLPDATAFAQRAIESWLEEFAAGLARPEILTRYRELRAQLGL
jgi:hypothetical protein